MPNKKIILSVLIICTVATIATASTWAYYQDIISCNGNVISLGTLHLNIDPDTSSLAIEDVSSGYSGTVEQTITNSGTLPGKLKIDFGNIQESIATEVPVTTAGKDTLLHSTKVNIKLVKANDGTLVKQLAGSESNNVPIISCKDLTIKNIPMDVNTAYKLVIYYEIPSDTDAGIQGKKLTLGITYMLYN